MAKKYFGGVRWSREDIEYALWDRGLIANKANVDAVFAACDNDHHFTDAMIEAGWAAINSRISDLLEGGELK